MSLTETTSDQPVPARNRKAKRKPPRLTPAIARAIDIMVWDGKPYNKAAQEVGITSRAMRLALGKPHVLAAMKAELQVLRSSEGARNFHTLRQVRDQKKNQMARVQAVHALERLSDEQTSPGKQALPGLVVQINVGTDARLTQPAPRIINNDEQST